MYFASRLQAGRMLAAQLAPKYTNKNCAVLALNSGGVMVGLQIAAKLHCVLMMLLTEEIKLPQEPDAVAAITQGGSFSFNEHYAPSEIDELMMEYRSVIDQEKLNKMEELNELAADGPLVREDLLKERNVILVADGFPNGFMLDVAMEYLKPIRTAKIIVAVPMASVEAVDRMHILADELYCLSVLPDYMSTDHYYDQMDAPSRAKSIEVVSRIVKSWRGVQVKTLTS